MKRADDNSGLLPIASSDCTGWHLTPEGAAVHLAERTAVIADVHLGYEWARGSRGDMVPAHSLPETLQKLSSLIRRVALERLIVAGDLVESRRPCAPTARDVRALESWLIERGIRLDILQGNHDPPRTPPCPVSLELGGWTITHGHRTVESSRLMIGHHHPILKGEGIRAPAYLLSRSLIVLPAFSDNAAGLDVSSSALPPDLVGRNYRLVAGLDGLLLDFGPLANLRRAPGVVEAEPIPEKTPGRRG
ncbi:MAG TPA: phosphoesterase [Isosphaeraceae bacterium]|nr:phosphoesterase [Isosphaeraceae bacterium]